MTAVSGIAKRVFLFIAMNLLMFIMFAVVFNILTLVFHVPLDGFYPVIILYSVVFGFGGAFVSLLLSKWFAKRRLGVKIIDPNTHDPALRQLVDIVYSLAKRARLPKMPEVGIYPSQEVNAFATGPSKHNSLVAVSTGLLNRMNIDQIEGVLGHEITHIANGDMVTMTLLQGVINSLVYFLADIITGMIVGNRRNSFFLSFAIMMVLEVAFSLLGTVFVLAPYSRRREFRADAGGARYAGRDKMVSALQALEGMQALVNPKDRSMATFKITGRPQSPLMKLISTHPPLEERIRRLQTAPIR